MGRSARRQETWSESVLKGIESAFIILEDTTIVLFRIQDKVDILARSQAQQTERRCSNTELESGLDAIWDLAIAIIDLGAATSERIIQLNEPSETRGSP